MGGMERRDLEEIERFVASLGHRTPLAYYGLSEDASPEAIDSAIKKRRTWAQGQQANPKYRTEALFLIKSNANLRKLLVDERELYHETFSGVDQKLAELNAFVTTTLQGSGWNSTAEATIRVVGARLELDEAVVEARIQAIARELNLVREGDSDLAELAGTDIYALLEVAPSATAAELEAAYRARYRWARTLKDLQKSAQILASLDAAWRIVRDPERRVAYDAQREGQVSDLTEEADPGEAEIGSSRIAELLLQNSAAPPPLTMPPLTMPSGTAPVAPPPPVEARAPTGPVRTAPPLTAPAPPPVTSAAPPITPSAFPVRPPVATPPPSPPESLPESAPLRLAGGVEAPIPNIPGRTIGLGSGPQKLRERAPKLSVGVKSAVRLHLPRMRSQIWVLRVENTGAGKMPGKLVSDVPWIVPTVEFLDPVAREQEIPIELRPSQLGGSSGVGTLTVVTDHGERRVVHFEVTKAGLMAPALAVVAVVGLAVGAFYGWQAWDAAHQPPPPAVLHLKITPAAEHVLVNGAEVGAGAVLDIAPPAHGHPFRVVIQATGYAPHEEMVTVGTSPLSRAITLKPLAAVVPAEPPSPTAPGAL
ncbi:hypothetical protein LBMAG42_30370 [Deltaproteobacteria bacterium]|nr:hypothetical protein LBMAG42_30370 [Deltaproteobacteria bacterium]